ncbi:glycosyltransferase family 4 protein [Desulfobacterota bacterium AH_259_B03_O07]|nr:glycosyltransferase family 4 protein [Desulfobacterota bacterium AH_259_B03_O07]
MKILYVTQYFPPEMGAGSSRAYEFSKYWVELGHHVTVLTCFPNYPTGVVPEEYRSRMKKLVLKEKIDNINIIRTWNYPTKFNSSIRRVLNYVSFLTSASLVAPFIEKHDLVLATSPPPLVGLAGFFISRFKKIQLVFETRDLWPEVMPYLGAGEESSKSYKVVDWLVGFLYKKSHCIVALTESFKYTLIYKKNIAASKIEVIENAVDTEFFKPISCIEKEKKLFGLEGKFIVSYIGTIGLSHGVGLVLNAAKQLKSILPNLVFLVVGEGGEKDRLLALKEKEDLTNVIFFKKQPRNMVPKIINASDICLVLVRKGRYFKEVISAKMFEFMACGKPIIVGADSETKKIGIEYGKAGLHVEPGNINELVKAIIKLYNEPGSRKKLGENGRRYVVKEYSRLDKAREYIEIFENVVRTRV